MTVLVSQTRMKHGQEEAPASAPWAPWAAAGGLIGAIALAASFVIVPHPPALGAPTAVLNAYFQAHHDLLLWVAWLEGTGSLLYVVYLVALAHEAGSMRRLSGVLTALAAALVLSVSLIYDICLIALAQSASTGGSQVTTSPSVYGLWAGTEHAFLLAPSIFLPLGFAIRHTKVLPHAYASLAIALGCASEALGLAGLFYAHANNAGTAGVAINALIAVQALWVITATLFTLRNTTTTARARREQARRTGFGVA